MACANRLSSAGVAVALLIVASAISTSVAVEADPTPSKWLSRPLRGSSTSPPPPPPSLAAAAVVDGFSSSSPFFRLVGDVYPTGLFYVEMEIGDPHPKPYFLDLDTGSDLTWVQCNAPCIRCNKGRHEPYNPSGKKVVPSTDPLCAALHHHHDSDVVGGGVVDVAVEAPLRRVAGIDAPPQLPPNRCDYEVSYTDNGRSKGALVRDAILLRFANGTRHLQGALAFGCGYDQSGGDPRVNKAIDGVIGLGGGSRVGLVSQLHAAGVIRRNVIGHCMNSRGGGYLFLDDHLVPDTIQWVHMINRSPAVGGGVEHPSPPPDEHNSYYSLPSAEMYIGSSKATSPLRASVVDSGSSFTYFASQPYFELVRGLKEHLKGKPLKLAPEDPTLTLCWKARKPLKSVDDVAKLFVPLSLQFRDQKQTVQLNIPPENYLIISSFGNACLGILNGGEVADLGDLNIIGDITMLDNLVVYDNEKKRIGWAPASCDRLPRRNKKPETTGIPSSL